MRWSIADLGASCPASQTGLSVRLARRAAALAGVDARRLEARPSREMGLVAPRPLYTVLGSERGWPMPPLEDALARYVRDHPSFGERARPRRARRMIAAAG